MNRFKRGVWATTKWLSIAFMVTVCLLWLAYYFAPKPDIKRFTPYSHAYFDKHGALLKLTLASDDRYRLYQPLSALSLSMVEATLLYEDQDYFNHRGVDFAAILRAAWDTYIIRSRKVGASTITMQVARLRWGIRSNTPSGKVMQILRAVQLSRHYSKNEILELYLNLAPYGRNIEGVAAASLIYFNKKPNELSLPEALTLAVIPQNPNKRHPSKQRNIAKLSKARQRLLQRWLEHHPEDNAKASLFDLPIVARSPAHLPSKAPHFVQYLNASNPVWSSGYKETTLDISKQQRLEKVLKEYVASKHNVGIKNAGALLINYQTMNIEAMVGSADFHNRAISGQVNAATAKRSPGSTLKPFVYGLAMDEGLIHPLSLLKDSPRRYGGFTPQNYDKQFWGPVSAKRALIESRNVPAIDLQAGLTKTTFHQFLKDAGVSRLKSAGHYGLALALGGGEVTMLELASLYAMLANQGELQKINALKNTGRDAQTSQKQSARRLLSKEASFMVLDMLKDNPPPDRNKVGNVRQQNQIAWKTGTSWAFRDAWAVGVSGPYVLAVWVGNFDAKGNGAFVGRSAAGPLLFSMFRSVNQDQGWRVEQTTGVEHLNLKQVEVCAETGDLFEQHCGSMANTWFIPGVSPIKVSNVYRAIPIDPISGLRACEHQPGVTQMKVFEFWPSDFLNIFKQAGVVLQTPPPYQKGCDLTAKATSGQKPVITSPQSTIEYAIRVEVEADRQIPLKAVVDSGVETLHWFVEKGYLGSTQGGTPLLWRASPGEYQVSVVDDSGRSASTQVRVKQLH